jgi:hypothetical protein
MSSYERSGWRDEAISRRHRMWGFNCPAVDLDFLVIEYHLGLPVGLIEYKHFKAQEPELLHPTYRALAALANDYKDPLPFLLSFYWPDIWAFRVTPVNDIARSHFYSGEIVSELEYVRRLYRMRSLVLTENLMKHLNNILPDSLALSYTGRTNR